MARGYAKVLEHRLLVIREYVGHRRSLHFLVRLATADARLFPWVTCYKEQTGGTQHDGWGGKQEGGRGYQG